MSVNKSKNVKKVPAPGKKASNTASSSKLRKVSTDGKKNSALQSSNPKSSNKLENAINYLKNNKGKVAGRAIQAAALTAHIVGLSKKLAIQNFASKAKNFITDTIPITKAILGEIFSESYEIGEVLGSGTFGSVFNAIDKKTGDKVIIKKATAVNPLYLPVVDNELQILRKIKKINNKYLAKYITHKYYKDNIYIVFASEYTTNLVTIIESNISDDIKEKIFYNCIKGLQVLHANKIAHNDIKWENIIGDKNTGSIKYIDFGLSCTGLCIGGAQNIGTDITMAPERKSLNNLPTITNGLKIALKTDVWSLGVVLYYLMYNKHPYSAYKLKTLRFLEDYKYNIIYDDKVVDKKYNDILRSMLEVDPDRRTDIGKISVPRNISSNAGPAKFFFGLF
jgi:tRNA A-37 threonylcarbamoyl transferase component Bud32